MNRFLFLFIFCLLSIFANAYPYRPHTKGAVNAIAHDENNLYVSSFKNGLYIIDKHSGRQTNHCTATGQPIAFPCMKKQYGLVVRKVG